MVFSVSLSHILDLSSSSFSLFVPEGEIATICSPDLEVIGERREDKILRYVPVILSVVDGPEKKIICNFWLDVFSKIYGNYGIEVIIISLGVKPSKVNKYTFGAHHYSILMRTWT